MKNNENNFVVYTVLTGNKENLRNPFPEGSKGYERICFTDNPKLKSEDWTVVFMDNQGLKPERESRRPKLLPHRFLADFEYSLYIDNTVEFKVDPLDIKNHYMNSESPLICFKHPWRDCAYEEAEIVIRQGIDDEYRVREQIDFYRSQGFPEHQGLIAGTMLFRQHLNSQLIELTEEWFNHVLRYSKRDQLSFPFVAWHHKFNYFCFDGSLTNNQLMKWLAPNGNLSRIPYGFDEDVYSWLNPEVESSGMSARQHYLEIGSKKRLPYRRFISELDIIANKYKTDKGTLYYNRHGYAAIYEQYLSQYKQANINLLEIGLLRHDVQNRNPGGPYDDVPSLKMWKEYFPKAFILGFDIADFSKCTPLENVKIIRGNMENISDFEIIVKEVSNKFDVIIDNASHAPHHQQIALGYLFEHLREGGFYFIENLHLQSSNIEVQGITKTQHILKNLSLGILVETNFLDTKTLKSLQENIEYIKFYDSQNRQFGKVFTDAFVVIKKKKKEINPLKLKEQNIYLLVNIPQLMMEEVVKERLSEFLSIILKHPQGKSFCIIFSCNTEKYEVFEEIILEASLEIFMDDHEFSSESDLSLSSPEVDLLTLSDLNKNQDLLQLIDYQIVIGENFSSETFWQNIPMIALEELSGIKFYLKDQQWIKSAPENNTFNFPLAITNLEKRSNINLNIIYPQDQWILEHMGNMILKYAPFTKAYYHDDPRLWSQNSPISQDKNHINFFINYAIFQQKTKNIDTALFTHPENDGKFEDIAKIIDHPICMCQKYADKLKREGIEASSIIPGIDPIFIPKLRLGFIGRVGSNLRYRNRKGADLLEQVNNLDFVELISTGMRYGKEELPHIYGSVDYILVTSRYEGGPMCVLEGLACGKKIICPHELGFVEEIEYKNNIINYQTGNINSLITVLKQLYQEKLAISQTVSQYTWKKWVDNLLDVFNMLLNHKNNNL